MPTPSPSSAKAVETTSKDDTAELARFRQEWLAELERRKADLLSTGNDIPAISADSTQQSQLPRSDTKEPIGQILKGNESALEATSSREPAPSRNLVIHPALDEHGRVASSSRISKALESALNIYRRAVVYEQRGELDQALLLYRQAFRLDDSVDRAYYYEQMLSSIEHTHKESSGLSAALETTLALKSVDSEVLSVTTGPLANLLATFAQKLLFDPENEEDPVFLNQLPEELLVMIIVTLDATSIERFARVCKKARILTLDPVIWTELVRITYHPPQVPETTVMIPIIKKCMFDYRRVYIEQPRVRLDGVYIANCHYVRPGSSDNSWVNVDILIRRAGFPLNLDSQVTHLITYHRYLRFFPDGQVLSLLANEEQSPQQIIPLLKPTLRMKGLFLGQWKLVGTTVQLSDLNDASGRFQIPAPTETADSPLEPSSGDRAKYVFDMMLDLQTRPLGRWNKMVIYSYDSVNTITGTVTPVALKRERPFWFSKVRSYV